MLMLHNIYRSSLSLKLVLEFDLVASTTGRDMYIVVRDVSSPC